ncbi:MAG: permease prefix domain 1-containing protein [Propionibacteriaceae bacterium]|jgi:hypothetical protein|nr:permease prefix domain 1-containing protein [Propionibacteriaceae bacterium]
MTTISDADLEARIADWRAFVERRQTISASDADELEGHLRDQIDDLRAAGLSAEEAFLVAVKRLGALDHLSLEFARDYSTQLWKQLVGSPSPAPERSSLGDRRLLVALALGAGAGLAAKIPSLFSDVVSENSLIIFYLHNISFLVLPFMTAYFAWRRRLPARMLAVLAAAYVVAIVTVNLTPFDITGDGSTFVLTAIHLPVVMWLLIGLAYTAVGWNSSRARMDFIRFSGEWFIYYVLIALGGGVLCGLTIAVFSAVGAEEAAAEAIVTWVLPLGAAGATLVATWLVEAKQSVVENMAPVLTKIFTPLFTVLLLVFLVTLAWQPPVDVEREFLIIFDLLLLVVLALFLYSLSARDPQRPVGLFDRLQLVLLVAALAIDLYVLIAMVSRIGAFGFSANKIASLGLNIILLSNLAWSAVLLTGFLRGRRPITALEQWQTDYLPVYLVWAAIVALVFPLVL